MDTLTEPIFQVQLFVVFIMSHNFPVFCQHRPQQGISLLCWTGLSGLKKMPVSQYSFISERHTLPHPYSPLRTEGSLHSTKQHRGCSQTSGYFWTQRFQIHYGRKILRRLDKDEWGHGRDDAPLSVCITHIAFKYIFLSRFLCLTLSATCCKRNQPES